MSKRTFVAFVISPELKAGLDEVKSRDGLPLKFQVQKAIEMWLEQRGIATKPAKESARKRAPKRK